MTSTSDASSSTRKGETSTTGRDSDTTIEENDKVGKQTYSPNTFFIISNKERLMGCMTPRSSIEKIIDKLLLPSSFIFTDWSGGGRHNEELKNILCRPLWK